MKKMNKQRDRENRQTFEVGDPFLVSHGFLNTYLKDKGNLLAVYLYLKTQRMAYTASDVGTDSFVVSSNGLCAALGKDVNYPAIVCAKNTVCTLIEKSKSLTDSCLQFVEPESVSKIRYGETYVRIGERDRSYKQGFSKIYLGEVQAILESDFKRKPDLFIVFFTIVSRIRPRKSGDDPKERPEACSISVRILCEFTGLSELRVSKAVRELKKLGVLCALTPTFPSRKDGNYVSLNTVYARGGHEDELNAKVKLLIHGKKTDLDF